MEKKMYVAGGVYKVYQRHGEPEVFSMVKPSGVHSLPYVSSNDRMLFGSTCHHAHLYSITDENTLTLKRESYEAWDVGAPKVVKLGWRDADTLRTAMNDPIFED
jgi:hypothetical protein